METSKTIVYILFAITLLFITGCATVQTDKEWQRINSFAIEKTGAEIIWQQSEDDAKRIDKEIDSLLSDGLTMDDAVRIALINNKRLQVALEEIGIAKADLVQAGLLTNPDLSMIFRFASGGGKVGIEAGGLFNISDIWQIPIRKKVASKRLEMSIYQTAEDILNIVKETKIAYINYSALSILRDEMQRMKNFTEQWRDHISYRERFGFSSTLDTQMAESIATDMELELLRMESELLNARYRLNRILGFSYSKDFRIDTHLTEEIQPIPELETLISQAISNRPAIKVAKIQVAEAERILELQQKSAFNKLEVGIVYERDTDGEKTVGTEIGMQIPIFDQNQAQIAKAGYKVRQKKKELDAKIEEIKEDISIIYQRLSFLHKQINSLKTRIIPIREQSVEFAQKYFNAMELNMLYLLEAQKNLIDTKKNYLNALKEYHEQLAVLEMTVGGIR